jgi:hypothetical protein
VLVLLYKCEGAHYVHTHIYAHNSRKTTLTLVLSLTILTKRSVIHTSVARTHTRFKRIQSAHTNTYKVLLYATVRPRACHNCRVVAALIQGPVRTQWLNLY